MKRMNMGLVLYFSSIGLVLTTIIARAIVPEFKLLGVEPSTLIYISMAGLVASLPTYILEKWIKQNDN